MFRSMLRNLIPGRTRAFIRSIPGFGASTGIQVFEGDAGNAAAAQGRRNWTNAQRYELESAIKFMEGDFFKQVMVACNDPGSRISKGYKDESTMKEFFADDEQRWETFVRHISGKSVLEIGPCVATALCAWDVAARRYVVEPLYDEIVRYQNDRFGMTAFSDAMAFSQPAEKLIPDLIGKIDGAILIRNCLDHSPRWPFILSNLADYAVRDCYLLLWNDLTHGPGYEEGHFDITDDAAAFQRIIEKLGFRVILDYQDPQNPNLNFGCLGVKV